ncbi:MAG: hypothetical protein QM653_15150 [Dysgonomonas sp.]|uniref:hypothetical protein n=1 Tax=Dysgonomonas sp. TaxID=1891233 RepID=UPI0039E4F21D
MKKIFYIFLFSFLLTACGSDDNYPAPNPDPTPSDWNGDWNDKNDKNYKPEGYNPIEGEWQAYSLNGKEYTDHYYIKFSDKRYMYEYTKKPAEGKDPVFNSFREYIINDKAFKAKTDLYYTYNLKNNILTLINSSSTWLLKPYIYKEWRWEGNWNDPKDSHFAEYQGKYNPIKGEWKITHIDGLETSSKSIITFTEDFKWINEIGEVSKYNINATGLESLKDYYRHKYTITDNTLILLTMFPKQGVPLTYKRIK